MADDSVVAWQRPYFKASDRATQIFFVCFATGPLRELPLSRSLFGLPHAELLQQLDIREHQRASSREWFENWWADAFGVIARDDLGEQLPLLTESQSCVTLAFDLPDQPDLAPQQTVWGLARWLCARGTSVVVDVHALRYRTRAQVEALRFDGPDLLRDVKLVFETSPTQGSQHVMHTRGLCKFARPELIALVEPSDVDAASTLMNQVARTLMEGATAEQIRLNAPGGVTLVTSGAVDAALVESLGLNGAVTLQRSDGASLAGIAQLVPAT